MIVLKRHYRTVQTEEGEEQVYMGMEVIYGHHLTPEIVAALSADYKQKIKDAGYDIAEAEPI